MANKESETSSNDRDGSKSTPTGMPLSLEDVIVAGVATILVKRRRKLTFRNNPTSGDQVFSRAVIVAVSLKLAQMFVPTLYQLI